MHFSDVHIRYFKDYLYHICLQDTIQSSQIVMSSLPSNVAAHATATSAPDHLVWFQPYILTPFVLSTSRVGGLLKSLQTYSSNIFHVSTRHQMATFGAFRACGTKVTEVEFEPKIQKVAVLMPTVRATSVGESL